MNILAKKSVKKEVKKSNFSRGNVTGWVVAIIVIIAVCFGVYLLFNQHNVLLAPEGTAISECTTINESGSYYLNQSIVNSGFYIQSSPLESYSCIYVNSSDVVLDLGEFEISEDDSIACAVASFGTNNITIFGGHINNLTALCLTSVNNSLFFDVSAESSLAYGAYIFDSNNITLYNSTFNKGLGNFGYGLLIQDVAGLNLSKVVASENAKSGLSVNTYQREAIPDLQIYNSTFNDNAEEGLSIQNVVNSSFEWINANGNGQDGISVLGSADNNFSNVAASSNNRGIALESSFNNTLENLNLLFNNLGVNPKGLYFYESAFNLISGVNVLSSGSGVGIYVDHSSDNFIANANTSGDSNGVGLVVSNNNILINIRMQNRMNLVLNDAHNNFIADNLLDANGSCNQLAVMDSRNNTLYSNLLINTGVCSFSDDGSPASIYGLGINLFNSESNLLFRNILFNSSDGVYDFYYDVDSNNSVCGNVYEVVNDSSSEGQTILTSCPTIDVNSMLQSYGLDSVDFNNILCDYGLGIDCTPATNTNTGTGNVKKSGAGGGGGGGPVIRVNQTNNNSNYVPFNDSDVVNQTSNVSGIGSNGLDGFDANSSGSNKWVVWIVVLAVLIAVVAVIIIYFLRMRANGGAGLAKQSSLMQSNNF